MIDENTSLRPEAQRAGPAPDPKPAAVARAEQFGARYAEELLTFLHDLDPVGTHNLWVRGAEGGGQMAALTFGWDQQDEAAAFAARWHDKGNFYYTANEVRRDLGPTKPTKADLVAIRVAFADIDPQDGVPLEEARAAALARIEGSTLGQKASHVVDSGGGYQVLYKLAAKVPASPDTIAAAEAQNRGLIAALGGDEGTHNADRLLRAPGTINFPDQAKQAKGRVRRRASVVSMNGTEVEAVRLAELAPPIDASQAADRSPRVREVMQDLQYSGYDCNSRLADLDADLRGRFLDDMDARPYLRRLWEGEKSGDDKSGSGYRASLAEIVGHINLDQPGRYSAVDYAHLAWVWDFSVQPGHDREERLTLRALARDWANIAETVAERKAAGMAMHFEPIADEVTGSQPVTGTAAGDLFGEAPSAPAKPKGIVLVPFHAAADTALTASTTPLVKGLLDRGTLSVVYGPSNVGKTFAAMSIAFHVAAGLPWGGMKATKGGVVYVAAEGGAGARRRADALRRHYGAAAQGIDFHLILQSLDLRRPDADVGPLIEALKARQPPVSLLVLDTLSRVMAGGEENGSTDMGVLVKHFDKIRLATGAHVMVVHHSGKDAARGARGHSLLRAATDTEIEIAERQIVVTKQRDLDKAWASAFDLKVVTLGRDEDGQDITSCVLELVTKNELPPAMATPLEQTVLDALIDGCPATPGSAVRAAELVDELSNSDRPMNVNAVRLHLRNLRTKGLVEKVKADQWRPKPQKLTSTTAFDPIGGEQGRWQTVAEAVVDGVFN